MTGLELMIKPKCFGKHMNNKFCALGITKLGCGFEDECYSISKKFGKVRVNPNEEPNGLVLAYFENGQMFAWGYCDADNCPQLKPKGAGV